jgi:DNA invertase Pin-like site-specific DNA recombinase
MSKAGPEAPGRAPETPVRRRGSRYDAAFTRKARELAEQRRRAGLSWTAIAKELGMGEETLRRWFVPGKRAKRSMQRVEIVTEAAVTTVSVVSPSGLRVEGLTVQEVIVLLRALG